MYMPASAQTDAQTAPFLPYTSCQLSNGLAVVETAPLVPGVEARTVQTVKGTRAVPMSSGRRIMFAYPGEEFYANVKVERLPAENWGESRAALVDNFDYLLASGDDVRNYELRGQMNGFTVQGQDRKKREGGVLGFYLLFEDRTHTVVTIYFLNQDPPVRFKTMNEYGSLRDSFLRDYTTCIRKNFSAR
jgi:hypothetical protein